WRTPPGSESGRLSSSRAVGAAGARLPDTEKVTGSNPVRPTRKVPTAKLRSGDLVVSAPYPAVFPDRIGFLICPRVVTAVALDVPRGLGRASGSGPRGPAAQPEQAENGKDERHEAVAAAVAGPHGGVGEGGRIGDAPGADRQDA